MIRILPLICLLALVACGQQAARPPADSAPEATATPASAVASLPSDAFHLVVSASDDVTYLRDGWRRRQVARFGTELRTGDVVDRPPTGALIVVCADLTVPPVEPGPKGIPCSDAQPVLRDGPNELTAVRGAGTAPPPLLLAPLPGALLDERPELRWSSLTATEAFTITLRDQDGELWRTVVPGDTTSLPFPAELAIEPGKRYTIAVVADGNLSSERAPGQHQIYLLGADERARLEGHRQQIAGLDLPAEARELLLARLALQSDLTTEAEALLAGLAAETPAAMTFMALADTEVKGMLYERAIEHYRLAIALAEDEGDEIVAQASWRIGKLYLEGIANPQLARENLTRARELYAGLLNDENAPLLAELDADLAAIAGP